MTTAAPPSPDFDITDAERGDAPVSILIDGMSGSGKTYSAFLLARGLVGPDGKIGIADTEGKRSLIYADDAAIGGFRHLNFDAPYSPDRCAKALDALVADGCDAIILDSASLEHDGEGGLLEMAEAEAEAILARNPNNRAVNQQKWTKPKLEHKKFLNHAVGLPCHVIATFRTTLTTDFDAKPKPLTIESVVREKNTPFFFDIHLALDASHNATWTRIPEPFRHCIEQGKPVSIQTGAKIREAVASGSPEPAKTPPAESDTKADPVGTIEDIATMIDSDGIGETYFNKGLAMVTKGKYSDYRDLPADWIDRLATDAGFAKVAEKAHEMKKQEGAE